MREVTKKDSEFSCNRSLEEEFQNVKRVVSSVDTLASYNPKLPPHFFTDASKGGGLGFILVQLGEGKEKQIV